MRTVLLVLMALCIVIFTIQSMVHDLFIKDIPTVRVEIPEGVGTRHIAHSLKKAGVIGSETWFVLNVRMQGIERQLKPGNYRFSGEWSMGRVINSLLRGQNELIRVTIPEGLTMEDTFTIFQKLGVGNYDRLMLLANDPEFASNLTGMDVETLEGFLYPNTYMMPPNLKEEAILGILVGEFHKACDPLLSETGRMTPYQTLVLASIVEREAKMPDEKSKIASVFLNRLARNQRLESCPTVLYAWHEQGVAKNRLLYADLDIVSPYNTYRHAGLPPAPICSPAASTVEAILNPDHTPYLFFHTQGTSGRHIFTRTLQEHDATRFRS